jgi:hypothetical protein
MEKNIPSVVQKPSDDPRTLLYFTPSINPIVIAKKLQKYYHSRTLEILDQVARATGRCVVPSCCLHWRKRLELPLEFRFQVGKEVFFLMRVEELTPGIIEKLQEYAEKNRERH